MVFLWYDFVWALFYVLSPEQSTVMCLQSLKLKSPRIRSCYGETMRRAEAESAAKKIKAFNNNPNMCNSTIADVKNGSE